MPPAFVDRLSPFDNVVVILFIELIDILVVDVVARVVVDPTVVTLNATRVPILGATWVLESCGLDDIEYNVQDDVVSTSAIL